MKRYFNQIENSQTPKPTKMKTPLTQIFIMFLLIIGTVSSSNSANAQCIAPNLKFLSPVLISGTSLSVGAKYKFSNVTPGVDCIVTIVKFNNGAKLITIKNTVDGYPDAWQPTIDGTTGPTGIKSWIDWNLSFQTTAGTPFIFPCLEMAAIDVDGDNTKVGEFIESNGHSKYTIPATSLLTITNMAGGITEVQGPVTNRPGIDTAAQDVRINFSYNNISSLNLKLGATIFPSSSGSAATQRLNCIYFKQVTLNPYFILPVTFLSLNANYSDNKVMINWSADNAISTNHFEVERSFDNDNFKAIAMLLDGFSINSSAKSYKFNDNAAELNSKSIVYYRIKQIDNNGKYSYSNIISVRIQNSTRDNVQVFPNPFIGNLNIGINTKLNCNAEIKLISVAGQVMSVNSYSVNKGYNNIQISNLNNLTKGIYVAIIKVNGEIVSSQKVIKN